MQMTRARAIMQRYAWTIPPKHAFIHLSIHEKCGNQVFIATKQESNHLISCEVKVATPPPPPPPPPAELLYIHAHASWLTLNYQLHGCVFYVLSNLHPKMLTCMYWAYSLVLPLLYIYYGKNVIITIPGLSSSLFSLPVHVHFVWQCMRQDNFLAKKLYPKCPTYFSLSCCAATLYQEFHCLTTSSQRLEVKE